MEWKRFKEIKKKEFIPIFPKHSAVLVEVYRSNDIGNIADATHERRKKRTAQFRHVHMSIVLCSALHCMGTANYVWYRPPVNFTSDSHNHTNHYIFLMVCLDEHFDESAYKELHSPIWTVTQSVMSINVLCQLQPLFQLFVWPRGFFLSTVYNRWRSDGFRNSWKTSSSYITENVLWYLIAINQPNWLVWL